MSFDLSEHKPEHIGCILIRLNTKVIFYTKVSLNYFMTYNSHLGLSD